MDRRRLTRWVEAATPPVLLPHVKRLAHPTRRPRSAPEWEHVPEGWSRARTDDLRGWDDPSVVDAYRTKLAAYRAAMDGTGPLAFASSPAIGMGDANVADQNLLLAFAHALLLAAHGKHRVSVLDWGGGLGFHAFVARAVLPADVELDYHCKDLPRVCAYGRDAVPGVTFWDDDRFFERTYDLVLASSALQYAEEWRITLGQLAAATSDALFLTRVPIVVEHPSFVVLQRTRDYRFDTEYLGWVFNRDELLAATRATGVALVREFLLGYRPHVVGAPEQDETWAFLFRR